MTKTITLNKKEEFVLRPSIDLGDYKVFFELIKSNISHSIECERKSKHSDKFFVTVTEDLHFLVDKEVNYKIVVIKDNYCFLVDSGKITVKTDKKPHKIEETVIAKKYSVDDIRKILGK